MELWVLGANGTYPTVGHPTAGYLLSHEETTVWVDAGSGTLAALQRLMDPAELDALVVSHSHVDHSVDVFPLYHYLRFGSIRERPLPLIAPDGVVDKLDAYVDSGGGSHFAEVFASRPARSGDRIVVGSLVLHIGSADHPVPTLQLRAEAGGRSCAYSADTGTGSQLVELAYGANTLIAEATFQGPTKPAPHHLTATEAGQVAQAAGVERLVLTHLLPTLDPNRSIEEAAAVFDGDVMMAAPGLNVTI